MMTHAARSIVASPASTPVGYVFWTDAEAQILDAVRGGDPFEVLSDVGTNMGNCLRDVLVSAGYGVVFQAVPMDAWVFDEAACQEKIRTAAASASTGKVVLVIPDHGGLNLPDITAVVVAVGQEMPEVQAIVFTGDTLDAP